MATVCDTSRRSARARRPPTKLDNGGDDHALLQALKKSLLEQRRVEHTPLEAPVLYPTPEDWADPLAYIRAHAEAGWRAGVVKIVTPEGWRPQFELDMSKPFPTKRQLIHSLQEGLPFEEGRTYDQRQYKAMADMWSMQWRAQHPQVVAAMESAGSPDAAAAVLEREYWRLVECMSGEKVTVDYASDINTTDYASGFGALTHERTWDLTTMPELPASLLSKVGGPIDGLTRPWLYFGALFATFCWHTEDHFLYSVNYMHAGAPKTWYGLPPSAASKFEELLHAAVPERFREDRDLLHQLVAMLPPGLLLEHGVPVHHCVQRVGDIVLTFPRAYHAGFSHGWNCAEATNFAPFDWLPWGRTAAERYCRGPGSRPAVFSHDKLLWDWAAQLAAPAAATVTVPPLAPPRTGASASLPGVVTGAAPPGVANGGAGSDGAGAGGTAHSGAAPAAAGGVGVQPCTAPPPGAGPASAAVGVSVPTQQQQQQQQQQRCCSGAEASTSAPAANGAATSASPAAGGGGGGGALQRQQLPSDAWQRYRSQVLRLHGSVLPGCQVEVEVDAAAAQAQLRSLGLDGQGLAGVHEHVAGMVLAELGYRDSMRGLGVREISAGAGGSAASDDRAACLVCSALPYLSHVRCECRKGAPRCWQHAELYECACGWEKHELATAHSDMEMLLLAFRLWSLLPPALQDAPANAAANQATVAPKYRPRGRPGKRKAPAAGPLGKRSRDVTPGLEPSAAPPAPCVAIKAEPPPAAAISAMAAALTAMGVPLPPPALACSGVQPSAAALSAAAEACIAAAAALQGNAPLVQPPAGAGASAAPLAAPQVHALLASALAGAGAVPAAATEASGSAGAPPLSEVAPAPRPHSRQPKPRDGAAAPAADGERGARRGAGRDKCAAKCTACGAGVGTKKALTCLACDCTYHAACVPVSARPGMEADDSGAIWLCEFCADAQ